jgi:hypothetical protein
MILQQASNPTLKTFVTIFKTLTLFGLLLIASCGGPPSTSSGWLVPPECVIVAGPNLIADSVTVALFHPVDPLHAPYPRNASERILFRNLYQTLISFDCMGEVQPVLAASWKKSEGGKVWSFELNENAQFWDGNPVTARDVVDSWERNKKALLAYDIDSTSIKDDRVVVVHFRNAHKNTPRLFSASEFYVAKPTVDSKWPHGSGPYQVVTSKKESSGMFKRTITTYPHGNSKGPVVLFVETSGYDARDLLDSVIDMMITTDPSVIDFAAKQPRLETVALPWERTYVLLSASRFRELWRGVTLDEVSPHLSEELARDAVRSEARSCTSPGWWEALDDCEDLNRIVSETVRNSWSSVTANVSPRILYDSQDPVARNIAERIIALAMTDPQASPAAAALAAAVPDIGNGMETVIAQGVEKKQLAKHLRMGSDFAYITSIPCNPADPCAEARKLINQIPRAAEMQANFAEIFVPLVDTRPHVIANGDRVKLSVDWFGHVVIMNGMHRER